MLRLHEGSGVPLCDGLTRRNFLRAGALGTLGLSWSGLLQSAARAGTRGGSRPARARSCIFVFCPGGPAQHETWDPKPDAPSEMRGEFKPIQTNITGTFVGEHLPKLAKLADKYCIVRSCHHDDPEHNSAAYSFLTGRMHPRKGQIVPPSPDDFPPYGAVLSKLRPTDKPIPNWVALPDYIINVGVPYPAQNAGWLGGAYNPLLIRTDPNQPNFKLESLTAESEFAGRLDGRWGLRGQLDGMSRWVDTATTMRTMDSCYQRAYTLLSSEKTKEAFDLTKEPASSRDRYGKTTWGQSLLLARRLVEAEVPLVTVYLSTNGNQVWDTHGNNFKELREKLLPSFDVGLSALLADLAERGLLDNTLVVCGGEFGRTPKINTSAGRDHWPWVYSTLYAGAGIRPGIVHGSSDRSGARPATHPVTPGDLAATLFHCLGVDPSSDIHDRLGRPFSIALGKPIQGILA